MRSGSRFSRATPKRSVRARAEAEFLADRYFDGHEILWEDAVDKLKVHANFIERLFVEKDYRDESDSHARIITRINAILAGKMTAENDGHGSRSEFYDARAAFERIKQSIDS